MEELERIIEKPEFWEDAQESQKVMKELKTLKEFLDLIKELTMLYEDTGMMVEMAEEEEDESLIPDIRKDLKKFEKEFVEQTGVRVIVGKGGMGPNTEYACKNFGAIHCIFPAGNAVVAATEVEEIVDANWRELGMPETLWSCHVKMFGPLIVSIDSYGRNFFEEQKVIYNQRKEEVYNEIIPNVKFIK